MAGFKLTEPTVTGRAIPLPVSSIAVTVGDLLEWIPGEATTWTLVTTSSLASSRKAIATQTVTSSATEVLGIILNGFELVEATSTNNSAVADNGNNMVIGTATTGAMVVNNTGTTVAAGATTLVAIFVQHAVLGAAADKRILGFVLSGSGASIAS